MPMGRCFRLDNLACSMGYQLTSMVLLRLTVTRRVTLSSCSKSKPWSLTQSDRDTEASVHTAVSSGDVYSTISQHKLEPRIVPKFCWLDLRLQWSLYIIYGVPVSIWASSMANHTSRADANVWTTLPCFSHVVYNSV